MNYSVVPSESKSQINKAGLILSRGSENPEEVKWAYDLVDRWRRSHAYTINTFQAHLRNKLKNYPRKPFAAQRLKRMPTITSKLILHPNMKLTTMQDVGGVRAVLGKVTDVYRLAYDDYINNLRFHHGLKAINDYVGEPRNEDGYRSLHLIYRYKNSRAPRYNGLLLELQIRTKLQHIWATAVESMGTFLGQALKSRQGDRNWLDFFAIASSAFAHMEESVPVPRYAHLSKEETFKHVKMAEKTLNALELMSGLSIAANAISKSRGSGKGWSYHLIILNSIKKTVKIKPYNRDSVEQALNDYSSIEVEAAKEGQIEPVLVSAGPLNELRRAYPNFFLDINDFTRQIKKLILSVS